MITGLAVSGWVRPLTLGALGLVVGLLLPAGAAEGAADPARAIAVLRTEIARHDAAYHRNAAPEISDYDYDQLKRRLAALEQEFLDAAKTAPVLPEIGDDRSGLF